MYTYVYIHIQMFICIYMNLWGILMHVFFRFPSFWWQTNCLLNVYIFVMIFIFERDVGFTKSSSRVDILICPTLFPFFLGGELFKRHQNIPTFVTTLKVNVCRNCTTLRKSALRNIFVASSHTWLSFFSIIFWWQRKKGCAMLHEKSTIIMCWPNMHRYAATVCTTLANNERWFNDIQFSSAVNMN